MDDKKISVELGEKSSINENNIVEKIKVFTFDQNESTESKLLRPPRPVKLPISASNSLKNYPISICLNESSSSESLKQSNSGSNRPNHNRSRSHDFDQESHRKKTVSNTLKDIGLKVNQKVQLIKSKKASDIETSRFEDTTYVKYRLNKSIKDFPIFNSIRFLQKLNYVKDANKPNSIWSVKFSPCSRLLATGGKDQNVYIWILSNSIEIIKDMARPYMKDSPSEEKNELIQKDESLPYQKKPFRIYSGHTSDILDLSWSKNLFLISASMDKTVRLWNVLKDKCLCIFQHNDFVTSLSFCPKDDRYFVSGSMDGIVRIWSVNEKRLHIMCDLATVANGGIITAVNYVNCGNIIAVGTYDGRCLFFNTELRYRTQIHVSKHKTVCKVTGIEPLHGEDKILVTSNDCKIRLFNLTDLTLICEYRGISNSNLQIKATPSIDGNIFSCGSEDGSIYCWNSNHAIPNERRDRNTFSQNFSPSNYIKEQESALLNMQSNNSLSQNNVFASAITSLSMASFSNVIVSEWVQKIDNCFKIYNAEVIATADHNGDIYLLLCVLPSSILSPSIF